MVNQKGSFWKNGEPTQWNDSKRVCPNASELTMCSETKCLEYIMGRRDRKK